MSDYELINSDGTLIEPPEARPLPAAEIAGFSVREATLDDLPWIDAQQKAKENRQRLGFLFESALIGKIEKKQALVAEATDGLGVEGRGSEQEASDSPVQHGRLDPLPTTLHPSRQRVGYLIAQDRYLKRDDLGLVVQMCVVPAYRRSLVAAHLLKAQFDRSAYGCKLYCCWCAQDLEANRFWEAMGFVPLAFRTGSPREKVKRPDGSKGPRIHIFWQKRIRQGDGGPGDASGGTPYWYPSETSGGRDRGVADRVADPAGDALERGEAGGAAGGVAGASAGGRGGEQAGSNHGGRGDPEARREAGEG
ncbi:MAG: GNAT family N-acetyltransferase [Planctomycetota bacterium]